MLHRVWALQGGVSSYHDSCFDVPQNGNSEAHIDPVEDYHSLPSHQILDRIIHHIRTVTESQSTDTFSTNLTLYTASASKTTTTSTSTSSTVTTTTESPTSTVAPSPGFTPLSTQLVRQGYMPSRKGRRNEDLARRKASPPVPTAPALPPGGFKFSYKDGHPTCHPGRYPEHVYCEECLDIVSTTTEIVTAKHTRTVTAKPSTVFRTKTKTLSSTSTVVLGDASTTLTFSATSTQTSVITATTTSTMTSVLPIATHYAACDPNNIVTHVNNIVVGVIIGTTGGLVGAPAKRPYDCCVACLQTANCGGSAFALAASSPQCELSLTGGACDPSQLFSDFETDNTATGGTDPGFSVSNSNCAVAVQGKRDAGSVNVSDAALLSARIVMGDTI